jgi:hypothetical protein
MIFFCAHKSKIYEVAKNNEIDRRMSKENDIKHKKNIWESCSHEDLDNLQFFFSDTFSIIYRFYNFWKIYQKKIFFFKFMLRPCALTHNRLKIANADPVR